MTRQRRHVVVGEGNVKVHFDDPSDAVDYAKKFGGVAIHLPPEPNENGPFPAMEGELMVMASYPDQVMKQLSFGAVKASPEEAAAYLAVVGKIEPYPDDA